MDFPRLWEQAGELWSKPVGKWIFGFVGAIVIGLATASFFLTRTTYANLGTFSAEDAPKVAQKLNESKIRYTQEQRSPGAFAFSVPEDQVNTAKLVVLEVAPDPTSSVWSPDLWKNRQSWSNTDFDKRALRIEQIESNLGRTIMAMNVVDRARVNISVPMEKPLFKQDEKPPKAIVTILPKKGQKLTTPVVEGIMEVVSNYVEGLDPKNVTVMDASTSRVVSGEAFKSQEPQQAALTQRTDLMTIQQQYQEHWQTALTQQLEKVVGVGNASVIVNPVINWDKVMSEAIEYKGAAPDGKGLVLSSQVQRESTDGGGAAPAVPAGATPNAESRTPTYPGTQPTAGGAVSGEKSSQIFNYLNNQTKTSTEKPGGAIEEISVGILVNNARVDPAQEKRINDVVTIAMGKKASVQVAAMPFADDLLKQITDPPKGQPVAGLPDWFFWMMGAVLGLAGLGIFYWLTKPRLNMGLGKGATALEPMFAAGPEAAMMGGIAISPQEMAMSELGPSSILREPMEKRLPETAEDVAKLPPEEIALLGDEFLQKLGVDPAKVRMKEKVEKIAARQPEAVAALLKTWISED